jgi:allantoin racemase
MVRIKVIIPNAGMDRATLDDRERMLSAGVSETTRVSVDCIKEGPESVESSVDEILVGRQILKGVVQAQKESFDAVVIYCFSDPALHAARQLVDIPVIGPGETSLALAGSLGHKYSVITTLRENIPRMEMRMRERGKDKLCLVSIRSLDIPVICLREDAEHTQQRLMEVCTKVIQEDGAEMILLGCLGLAGYGFPVQERYSIPIIDPSFVSVGMAELLARLKMRHSRITFPRVDLLTAL